MTPLMSPLWTIGKIFGWILEVLGFDKVKSKGRHSPCHLLSFSSAHLAGAQLSLFKKIWAYLFCSVVLWLICADLISCLQMWDSACWKTWTNLATSGVRSGNAWNGSTAKWVAFEFCAFSADWNNQDCYEKNKESIQFLNWSWKNGREIQTCLFEKDHVRGEAWPVGHARFQS